MTSEEGDEKRGLDTSVGVRIWEQQKNNSTRPMASFPLQERNNSIRVSRNSPRKQQKNNSTLPIVSPGILFLTMNNIRTKFHPNCSCSCHFMSLHALLIVMILRGSLEIGHSMLV
ncbi:hypothetical protein AVEN_152610-1 [Araneus ventricosus]|uniref:Uncharacterized protein n=1 Tax=Araneus ventricosus TaxID=182803 RepID=A0A4Y2U6S7_ARAVE|nr:hypothetical protein AVEN_152610-1 [Araneus ventricosus]